LAVSSFGEFVRRKFAAKTQYIFAALNMHSPHEIYASSMMLGPFRGKRAAYTAWKIAQFPAVFRGF